MTGYSGDELASLSFWELALAEERPRLERMDRLRIAGESVPELHETVIVRKDGARVPVELTASPTFWQGRPALLLVLRDLGERARAEQALRDSEPATAPSSRIPEPRCSWTRTI